MSRIEYDYHGALSRLHALVSSIEARGIRAADATAGAAAATGAAAAAAPRTQAAAALLFWRANWRSLAALLVLYSVPTAAVAARFFAERQQQVCVRACAAAVAPWRCMRAGGDLSVRALRQNCTTSCPPLFTHPSIVLLGAVGAAAGGGAAAAHRGRDRKVS